MAEIEIKRTNFFDGQFLKQDEFLDLDKYHVHFRRRWAFVLFNQSGVVQSTAADLSLQVPVAAQPVIVVQPGMAIGKRLDLMEAKEIVLRVEKSINLSVISTEVPIALVAGNTGFVTVHYLEEPVANPVSEGDVAGNTRILEHARITVHNAAPGPTAPNGEPYIRLGEVTVNVTTAVTPPAPANRQTAFLNGLLLAATPAINLSDNSFPANGVVNNVIVTASGGLNLAGAVTVTIFPADPGISVAISNQAAASMTLDFTMAGATPGPHTITVTANAAASASFTIEAGLALTSFGGVNQLPPANDTLFKINGSGFTGATLIEFTKTGGGFTSPPIALPAGNVTPGQLTVPLALIPNDAAVGPVRVQSAAQTVTSGFNVTPPPAVDPLGLPATMVRNNAVHIDGRRFFTNVEVRFFNPANTAVITKTPPSFPNAALGETRTDTDLDVFVANSTPPADYTVTITNAGGTIAGGIIKVTVI